MPREPKKVKKGVALAGVNAGTTAVCTVGHSGNDLHYRGYDILELAKECSFEEVAFLLIHGELPNVTQLDKYTNQIKKLRDIPAHLKTVLEQISLIFLLLTSFLFKDVTISGISSISFFFSNNF